jgi:hypothetical protein
MDIRADFFNIMNHANWGNPGTSIASSATFGQITSFGTPARDPDGGETVLLTLTTADLESGAGTSACPLFAVEHAFSLPICRPRIADN